MSYRIAGIDVHKRMLAVVVSEVEVYGEYSFERRTFGTSGKAMARTGLAGIELERADGEVEGYHPRTFRLRGGFTFPPASRFPRPPYNAGRPNFSGPV